MTQLCIPPLVPIERVGRSGRQLRGDAGKRIATYRLLGLGAMLLLAIAGAPPASAQTLSEAVAAYKRGDYATANRWFRRLAEQGVARAQAALGLMYENGRGVRRNDAEAVRWYRRAAEQGFAAAQSALGVMYAKGRGVPQSDKEAVRWFRRAAEGGDALAQGILGKFYENGVGVPRDPVRAYKWYRLAASSTNAKVRRGAAANLRRLGQRLTPAQRARAQRLARQWRPRKPTARTTRPRARAERPPAGTSASLAFRNAVRAHARGNHAAAYRGFRRLAEQGFAAAQFNLGLMYSSGKGVPQDHAEAAKWYRRASDQGNAGAQNMLGFLYGRGLGVRKNNAAAARLYRRAAEQGHARAQFNLGTMYRRGHGVAKNPVKAARWYRRAAEQGVVQAQNNLGFMYETGSGVPRDRVAALKWYTIAAARFSDSNDRSFAARNRGRVAARLTAAQRARAQRLARQWRPRKETARRSRPGHGGSGTRGGIAETRRRVANVQRLLAELGYDPGPADGVMGPRTRAAIRAFQTTVGLPADGRLSNGLAAAFVVAIRAVRATRKASAGVGPQRRGMRKASTGSGFRVSRQGLILTNAHVVRGCAEVRVAPAPNVPSRRVAVSARNDPADLALLRGRAGRPSAAFRLGRGVRPAARVLVAGYPLHDLLSAGVNVSTGNVAALAGPGDDHRLIQITAPIQKGNSGGPVLDSAGNVVGVVVSKLNALKVARATGDIPQNVNFAVSAGTARAFLDAEGVAYSTAPSDKPRAPEDVAAAARKFTVLVECWK